MNGCILERTKNTKIKGKMKENIKTSQNIFRTLYPSISGVSTPTAPHTGLFAHRTENTWFYVADLGKILTCSHFFLKECAPKSFYISWLQWEGMDHWILGSPLSYIGKAPQGTDPGLAIFYQVLYIPDIILHKILWPLHLIGKPPKEIFG